MYDGGAAAWTACRTCERLYETGHPWVVVDKYGARPERWEFCSIECLGSYFELPELPGKAEATL
jgi:hypothetical protein